MMLNLNNPPNLICILSQNFLLCAWKINVSFQNTLLSELNSVFVSVMCIFYLALYSFT